LEASEWAHRLVTSCLKKSTHLRNNKKTVWCQKCVCVYSFSSFHAIYEEEEEEEEEEDDDFNFQSGILYYLPRDSNSFCADWAHASKLQIPRISFTSTPKIVIKHSREVAKVSRTVGKDIKISQDIASREFVWLSHTWATIRSRDYWGQNNKLIVLLGTRVTMEKKRD
jgi:hypothetical protein